MSKILLTILVLWFFSNCALSNFLECGALDCRKNNNFLAFLGLIASSQCELPASSSGGGLQDDPTQYASFTNRILDSEWNANYIRKILHTFAWGGPVSEEQIQAWAKDTPQNAIVQILSFDPVNPRMNMPYYGSIAASPSSASLYCLSNELSSGASLLPANSRGTYSLNFSSAANNIFPVVAQMKGLNPVRNCIGFIETNYHMSTNSRLVGPRPQYRLFDETMNLLASGTTYDQVLANGAVSAAIAIQYNHRKNRFDDAQFSGNEDFAREFHQLFFGVLGTGSTSGDINQTTQAFKDHETITVPETAKALTDIRIGAYTSSETNIDIPTYGTDFHIPRDITIYGQTVSGANAKEKIANSAKRAIANAESLNNLPLKLVRFIADDNLDESDINAASPTAAQLAVQSKANQIRQIWSQLPEKNLLIFLRRYALSTAFYNQNRIKYRTSANRIFTIANLVTLSNSEISAGYHSTFTPLANEDFTTFSPSHDVFGGQTGIEARDTPDVFLNAYNTSTRTPDKWGLGIARSGSAIVYRKGFNLVIPKASDGTWRVKNVAEFLWNRFIGDGLANFGNLERAHVYALLGSGTDLSYFLASDKKDQTINTVSYSETDIATLVNATKISDAAESVMQLDDGGTRGDEDRTRIGLAIDFIVATPYMFAVEGK